MFGSYRDGFFALGLICGISITLNILGWLSAGFDWVDLEKTKPDTDTYAEQQCSRQSLEHSEWLAFSNSPNFGTNQEVSKGPRYNERDEPDWCDLAAQQSMADSTVSLENSAWLTVGLTGLGVALLWWTLSLTRETLREAKEATRAAQETVITTREVGRDQSRAYLHVDRVEFFWGNADMKAPRARIYVKNSGQTPAKWYRIRIKPTIIPLKGGTFPNDWSSVGISGDFTGKWSGVASHEDGLNATISLTDEQDEIVKALEPHFGHSENGFYLFGEVKYCTLFGEIYVSQFCFGIHGLRPFVKGESTSRLIEPRDGFPSYTRSIIKEDPIPLHRWSFNLDSFLRVGGEN